MLAVGVLEIVEDPLVLEEPGDEAEGGLLILHAVLARVVGAGQAALEIGEPQVPEELLGDVGNGFVLKDFAVGLLGEHPEPGDELGVVDGEALLRPRLVDRAGIGEA